jgi:ribonuclease VapC
MIVDTSALLAVVFEESDAAVFARAILEAPRPSMSAATLLEAWIVTDGRRSDVLSTKAGEIVRELGIDVVPLTNLHADLARDAYRRFGKGNHPAALNFGDCIAYALSAANGEPLLFKGDDFARTDVTPALQR